MKLIASEFTFRYTEFSSPVFSSMNFTTGCFSRLGIIGRSGSGKSTLLRVIGGSLQAGLGKVTLEGGDAAQGGFGYVHQEPAILPWLNVVRNSSLGAELAPQRLNSEFREDTRRRLLVSFGLVDRQHSLPRTLSGGMKQRLALVNALSSGASALLLDEAFSASDARYRGTIFSELKSFAFEESGRSIIFITHEMADIVELSDMVLCLPNSPDGQPTIIDASKGWTKSSRKQLAELMLGEKL